MTIKLCSHDRLTSCEAMNRGQRNAVKAVQCDVPSKDVSAFAEQLGRSEIKQIFDVFLGRRAFYRFGSWTRNLCNMSQGEMMF